MTEPTSSFRIVVPTTGDLVFSGVDDGTPLGLISMSRPVLLHRRTYADPSLHVGGNLMTQSVPESTNITVVVGVKSTDQTSLEAWEVAIRAACSARRTVVTERNGFTTSLYADTGEMSPIEGDDDYLNLRDFELFFTLTFPIQPLEG